MSARSRLARFFARNAAPSSLDIMRERVATCELRIAHTSGDVSVECIAAMTCLDAARDAARECERSAVRVSLVLPDVTWFWHPTREKA